MAGKGLITLGEVAARDVATIDIRCGRCDRHGRLSVKRLLCSYGPDASIRDIMREQIGPCPRRNDMQLYTRSVRHTRASRSAAGRGGPNIPSTGWVDRNIPLTGWGSQNISTKTAASASATKIGPMKCDIMDYTLAGQSSMPGCLRTLPLSTHHCCVLGHNGASSSFVVSGGVRGCRRAGGFRHGVCADEPDAAP